MKKNNIISILGVMLLCSIIGVFIFCINKKNYQIEKNKKIIDSLQNSLLEYRKINDSLYIVANKLDSIILNQEAIVIKVKENFIIYKTPEMKNSSDAYIYLKKFIVE